MAEIKTLFDIVNTKEIKSFIDNTALLANKKPHTFEKYFPIEDTNTLTVEFLKEKLSVDRILSASTFDSDVPLRGYKGIESAKTQMAYFNEGQMVGENDLERLNDLLQLNVTSNSVKSFIDKTFRRFTALVNGAYDVPEYARAQMVVNGAFTHKRANEFGGEELYKYDFDSSNAWKTTHNIPLTGTSAWSDTVNSDPIKDISDIDDKASKQGLQIVTMVIGKTAFNYFKTNQKIKQQLTTQFNPLGIVNNETLTQLISSVLGYSFEIVVDNESYKGTDNNDAFFYPQDKNVTFICRPTVGTTYFGLTPEEIAKNSPYGADMDVTRLERGIVISTDWKKKPVQKTMICSLITLPTPDYLDAIYNLTWA